MHIAEGVLSAPVLITGAAAAAAGIAVGLKRLDESRLMTAGLVGAAFFIASLIHVPIGVSSAHLLLCGLVGVMLGVSAYPVIFTALLLQGVLFEFGGLAVLGVNTTTMGTGASKLPAAAPVSTQMTQPAAPPKKDSAAAAMSEAELEAVFSRVLDKKLAPVYRELALSHDKTPGIPEIVGGMGWLIGLGGITAWARRRRS